MKPFNWPTLKGQTHILDSFPYTTVTGAWVFQGLGGAGKRMTIATILSKMWSHKLDISSRWQHVMQGSDPDVFLYEGKDLTRSVLMGERQRWNSTPYHDFKAVIITGVDEISASCGHGLLKIVEDPLGPMKFFFTYQRSIMPTLLSRCHRYKVQPLCYRDFIPMLSLNQSSEQDKMLLWSMAQGSLGQALRWMQQDFWPQIFPLWDQLVLRQIKTLPEAIHQFFQENFSDFLYLLEGWMNQVLRHQRGNTVFQYRNTMGWYMLRESIITFAEEAVRLRIRKEYVITCIYQWLGWKWCS